MTVSSYIRTRVLGPGEQLDESIYSARTGEEARIALNKTEFREAERRYKKKTTDLSDVIDFRNLEKNTPANLKRIRPRAFEGPLLEEIIPDATMFELEGLEGFLFLPNALGVDAQKYWLKRTFESYINPPNLTNLDAHYEIPDCGLWKLHSSLGDNIHSFTKKAIVCESENVPEQVMIRPAELLKKIRWTTLGYQYNWTLKVYDFDSAPNRFPEDLAKFSHDLARSCGFQDYKAEAGIVNYYQHDDSLTGHADRSERNMDAPLFSISFGLSCIFLIGGTDRNDPVTPMIIRSGDILVMSGPSRFYFHGVPRILDEGGDTFDSKESSFEDEIDEWEKFLPFITNSRVNINIRQVN